MSRAFVSEEAAEREASVLPERPVSTAPNLVTRNGLLRIEQQVAALRAALASAAPDDPDRPRLTRDLRYWRARQASALLTEPPAGLPVTVAFGTGVTVRRAGATVRYAIVGEDEADPARGWLGWTSPLATALMGAEAGDVVEVGAGRPPVTVVAVERP